MEKRQGVSRGKGLGWGLGAKGDGWEGQLEKV